MKFKVDENLPQEVCQLLQEAGYDALTVLDQNLKGAQDTLLVDVCRMEERSLITLDLDFADIRTYPPQNYAGLIVIRLKRQDRYTILAAFKRLIPLLPEYTLSHSLWIVDENRLRIRE